MTDWLLEGIDAFDHSHTGEGVAITIQLRPETKLTVYAHDALPFILLSRIVLHENCQVISFVGCVGVFSSSCHTPTHPHPHLPTHTRTYPHHQGYRFFGLCSIVGS